MQRPNMRLLSAAALLQLAAADPPGRITPDVPTWALSFTDGQVLQDMVDTAIAKGARTLVIPAANYAFTGAVRQLTIDGASNLAIKGHGPLATSLWFFPGHGAHPRVCVCARPPARPPAYLRVCACVLHMCCTCCVRV